MTTPQGATWQRATPQRTTWQRATPSQLTPPPGQSRAIAVADALTRRQWDELTDIVMRRMERRVADELARRGRNVSKRSF